MNCGAHVYHISTLRVYLTLTNLSLSSVETLLSVPEQETSASHHSLVLLHQQHCDLGNCWSQDLLCCSIFHWSYLPEVAAVCFVNRTFAGPRLQMLRSSIMSHTIRCMQPATQADRSSTANRLGRILKGAVPGTTMLCSFGPAKPLAVIATAMYSLLFIRFENSRPSILRDTYTIILFTHPNVCPLISRINLADMLLTLHMKDQPDHGLHVSCSLPLPVKLLILYIHLFLLLEVSTESCML